MCDGAFLYVRCVIFFNDPLVPNIMRCDTANQAAKIVRIAEPEGTQPDYFSLSIAEGAFEYSLRCVVHGHTLSMGFD